MSTLPGADLYTRLRDLEARIAALEQGGATGLSGTDQTIKGCHDRIDAMIGAGNATPPATPTASRVLAMDANARFPSHDVTGDLGHVGGLINKTTDLARHYRSAVGIRANPTSGTFYDMVKLTTPGTGQYSNHHGVLTGTLEVVALWRNTGGSAGNESRRYRVAAEQRANNAITVGLEQIGTSYKQGLGGTLVVQVKAGATAALATIEFSLTVANLQTSYVGVAWRFDLVSYAVASQSFITPALA